MNAIWIATSHDRMSINEKNTRLFSKIAVQQIIDCCTKDDNGNTKLQVKDKGSKTYRNVSFKDFAVLARTSNEMKYIEKALKNAGIPYVRYKDTKLFLGRECIHWISLLEAINSIDFTGRNRNIFKKVLFTSFFGYSIEEIKSDSFNRDDNFANDKINKWKELAYIHNWEDMFDDIIVNSNLVEKLKSLKEIQTLSIYKQIANYCIDYLSSGRSMDELIRTLKNLSKGGTDESDDPTGSLVEKSTNFDCVQIMTIHASKGLQFPVVIGVCGFSAPFNGGEVFTYHKMDENTKKEKQILTFRKNELVSLENEAEWKRLFYVAYTRAQFLLILPFYSKYGRDFLEKSIKGLMSEHADSIRFIEDNHLTYSELRNCSSKILSSKDVEVESNEEKLEQDEILKHLIKNSYTKKSYKHSYSSLSHDLNEHEEYDYENKEGVMIEDLSLFDLDSKNVIMEYDNSSNYVSLPADYPKGARLGTALHEILENTDFANYKDNIENIIKRCFMNQGVIAKDSWVDATIDLIKNVVNIKLPIIQGSESNGEYIKLNQISSVNRKDEMEFNFNILNQKLKNYCNGYVDLVFKNGDYYSIIDWKSDALNEDFESYKDNNSLKSHVDKCYSIQRVLYSYCLIKWLKMYKPNLTEQEIFEKHFGGIYYVFLRGCSFDTYNGVYAQTWSSWKNIEDAFNKIIKEKVGG